MNFKKHFFILALLLLSGFTPARVQAACGNNNPGGLAALINFLGDPVVPYTGNEFRDVNDLQIWGGVGHHQLHWSRHASSRAVNTSDLFGQGHYWRHNYQWYLNSAQTDSLGRKQISIIEPTGGVWFFTQVSPTQWSGAASCTSQLIPPG